MTTPQREQAAFCRAALLLGFIVSLEVSLARLRIAMRRCLAA